jgi:hypothetical protein
VLPSVFFSRPHVFFCCFFEIQVMKQPRTQVLSLGKTLAAAGHVPHQKLSARGGVGKVLNYINMLPVGYSLKT